MKPTVFFSHSSLDRDRIKPIKEHILGGIRGTSMISFVKGKTEISLDLPN
ncbi:MAG: hypothetical protein JRE23_18650 [Deltaproteobacteria bacterium]|nr:hypothetical protein [Deltaproteobacteria bacterium]